MILPLFTSVAVLSIPPIVTSGCGRISSAEAKGLPSGKFYQPHINDAQLDLIQSDHPTKMKLGWGAISRNLRLGATPTIEQLEKIQMAHQKRPIVESIKTMNVLSKATEKPALNWNDSKIISKIQSQDIENKVFIQSVEEQETVSDQPLYSYEDFLAGSQETDFRQKLFDSDSSSIQYFPGISLSNTTLSLNPGKVEPGTYSDVTMSGVGGYANTQYLFLSQSISSIDDFIMDASNRYPTFESTLKNSLGVSQLSGNSSIQCQYLKVKGQQTIGGSTIGNGVTERDLVMQYTCVNFKPYSPVSSVHGRTSRYQFTSAGSFMLPVPGKHTIPVNTPNAFLDGIKWFSKVPSYQMILRQQISPVSRWIAVRLSHELTPSPYLNAQSIKTYFPEMAHRQNYVGEAFCKKGCTAITPFAELKGGWLIFGADTTGTAEIEVQGPLPLLNNFGLPVPFQTYVDIWEPSTLAFDKASDPSTLPELTQELPPTEPLQLLNLWSTGMQPSNWIIPRLKHPELEGAISLSRLKLIRDSIGTKHVNQLLGGHPLTKEWLESIIVAHSSVLIPRIEELLEEYHLSHLSIALIKSTVDQALVNLAGLSENFGYQLIGYVSDGLKMERVSEKEIQNREELEEAIFGAWELARASEEQYRIRLLLLCKTLDAARISPESRLSSLIHSPSESAEKICQSLKEPQQ